MWKLVWPWCSFKFWPTLSACIWIEKGYNPESNFRRLYIGINYWYKYDKYTSKTLPRIINIDVD